MKTTFMKYFISFFLLFLIPVLVLGALLYWNTVRKLQEEVESFNLAKINQARTLLDEQFRGLEQTAGKISFDPRMSSYMFTGDAYTRIEAIEELKRYKINNPFADDLYVYFKDDVQIYSSAGSSSLPTFLQVMLGSTEETELIRQLRQSDQRRIGIYENMDTNMAEKKTVVTYMVPIPLHTPYTNGSVLFSINGERISSLLQSVLGDFAGTVVILDEHKRVVANKSSIDASLPEFSQMLEGTAASGLEERSWRGVHYSIASDQSELLGWRFSIVMPTEQFFAEALETRSLFYYMIIILVISGICSSYLLSHTHYRPIRKLVKYTKGFGSTAVGSNASSEFEHIQLILDEAITSHDELKKEVEEQQPLVREKIIVRLLRGEFVNDDEAGKVLDAVSIHLSGPSYFVLYISWQNRSPDENSNTYEHVIRELAYITFAEGWGYGADMGYDHTVTLLVNVNERASDARSLQERIVTQLHRQITREFGQEPTIGVSNMGEHVSSISRCFIEASAAYEYKWKFGTGIPIFFDDIKTAQNNFEWYPMEHQVRFIQSLKQGNREAAIDTLKAMNESLKTNETSFLMLKSICFEMINAVLKTMNEMNVADCSRYAKELMVFQTLDELQLKMQNLILIVCGHVEQTRESNNNHLKNSVLNYIQESYQEYDFSLDKVAERLQVSSSYLGRFIKDQTGHTFMDYVTYLKMDEVKRRLIHSDASVQEIIEGVGYQSMSSFIRKFKALEGITPGQYRILYAKTGKEEETE